MVMEVEKAPDIQQMVERILSVMNYDYINENRIICMRSYNSKANAYARIWSMPRIWQKALGIKSHYVIEVISEKFDNLDGEDQERTLIHEIMHIPKTFSGALVPHKCFGKIIDDKAVEKIYKEYKKRMKEFE